MRGLDVFLLLTLLPSAIKMALGSGTPPGHGPPLAGDGRGGADHSTPAAQAAAGAGHAGQVYEKSKRPPLGWSSWYAFGGCGSVNQSKMEETFEKLVNRTVVPGFNKSLHDVGYQFANLDDGWQDCGKGVNGGFHDSDGYPMMNPVTFPNVSAMTAKAHSLGLSPGFYVNNYQCGGGDCAGGVGSPQYYKVMNSTVQWLKENGFEYLKVDSGGCYNDMELWHELLVAADWDITVENCHQGGQPPNATWCPFDLWRVGPDVNGIGPDNEIARVIAALNGTFPRAGCRPYPDFMSFSSNVAETQSLFGIYAIMGTPMVMSFDIRDDSKLLPIWDTLTNEEVLSVNQDTTAPVGTLVQKFSAHPSSAPEYAWAVACNASDPAQNGWSYDESNKQLKWGGKCLDGSKGQSVMLTDCGSPSTPGAQSWILTGKRVWQAASEGGRFKETGVGSIALAKCAAPASNPGQQWQYSLGGTTNVQVNLTTRMGGCWEITGCATGDGASVGTTYGCKGLPQNCKSACDCNGAWTFNAGNNTITSVMSGKCLEAKTTHVGSPVEVSSCTGKLNQQWSWHTGDGVNQLTAGSEITGQIASKASDSFCIDDGDFPAPPGTDGKCIALTHNDGGEGPGISLVNAGNNGHCDPSKPAGADESFSLSTSDGTVAIGTGQCMAALHGKPSPYGPMQLWAKQMQGGAVAVLLANRGTSGDVVKATVSLADLPGGLKAGDKYTIRDLWKHQNIPNAGVLSDDGTLTMKAPPQGSEFLILTPR